LAERVANHFQRPRFPANVFFRNDCRFTESYRYPVRVKPRRVVSVAKTRWPAAFSSHCGADEFFFSPSFLRFDNDYHSSVLAVAFKQVVRFRARSPRKTIAVPKTHSGFSPNNY
jgi:hypothetical protein